MRDRSLTWRLVGSPCRPMLARTISTPEPQARRAWEATQGHLIEEDVNALIFDSPPGGTRSPEASDRTPRTTRVMTATEAYGRRANSCAESTRPESSRPVAVAGARGAPPHTPHSSRHRAAPPAHA